MLNVALVSTVQHVAACVIQAMWWRGLSPLSPPPKKIILCPQNDKFGCILLQPLNLLTIMFVWHLFLIIIILNLKKNKNNNNISIPSVCHTLEICPNTRAHWQVSNWMSKIKFLDLSDQCREFFPDCLQCNNYQIKIMFSRLLLPPHMLPDTNALSLQLSTVQYIHCCIRKHFQF